MIASVCYYSMDLKFTGVFHKDDSIVLLSVCLY